MKTVDLDISYEYIEREESRGMVGLYKWITDYAKRNGIHFYCSRKGVGYPFHQPMAYLQLCFRSPHQMRAFQRRGNEQYPYFEFL